MKVASAKLLLNYGKKALGSVCSFLLYTLNSNPEE
jgi:hypothetical protein